MPFESTPVKNESGRWFEKIIDLTNDLRSEYQRALHDQAIDHASNLHRVDRDIRELRQAVADAAKPKPCPAECQIRISALEKAVAWRNWLLGIAVALAVLTFILDVTPGIIAHIKTMLGILK